ncbi:MAG: type II toxin-antitoxin system RelE/ParE family toxin [Bacteroidota bacterium]
MSALLIHWSTRALERASEAMDYIARYDADRAERWVEDLFEHTEKISDFPRMGRVVPEVGRDTIREVFFEQFRVIYRITPARIEIMTLRHMRENLDADDLKE